MAKGKSKSAVMKGAGKGMAAPKEAVDMPPAKVAKGAAKRGKRGM